MHFCPIMPTRINPLFGNRTGYHMALAQFMTHQAYREFFQQKVQDGEVVILNNGAYGGRQVQPWELDFWATELKPQVVVLPDVPGDRKKTHQASESYFFKYDVPKEAMLVLHAEDEKLDDFVAGYAHCPTTWVGFSRMTRNYGPRYDWPCQRWKFAKYLKEEGFWRAELKHHALGMLNGDFQELYKLADEGFHSVDSSAPIWRGLHGYGLLDKKWPGYEFNPEVGTEVNNLVRAQENLDKVLKACEGRRE